MVKFEVTILTVLVSVAYCASLPAPAPEERVRWQRQAHLWPQYSWKKSSPSARPSTTTTVTPSTSPPEDKSAKRGKKTPGLPIKKSNPQVHHLGDGSHHDWWRKWITAQAEAGARLIKQQEEKEKAEQEAKQIMAEMSSEMSREEPHKEALDAPQPGPSGHRKRKLCKGHDCVHCDQPGPRCAGKAVYKVDSDSDEASANPPPQITPPDTPNPYAPYSVEQLLECCMDCEDGSCQCDAVQDCNLFMHRFPHLREDLARRRKTSRRRQYGPYSKTKYDLPSTPQPPPPGGSAGLALAGLAASTLLSGPREPFLRSAEKENLAGQYDSDTQFGKLVANTLRESGLSVVQKLGLQGEILSLIANKIREFPLGRKE